MQKTNIGINDRANILAVFAFTILGTSNLTELISGFSCSFISFVLFFSNNIK